jgi:hypothetical protein
MRADADLTDEETAYRDALFRYEPRIHEGATDEPRSADN